MNERLNTSISLIVCDSIYKAVDEAINVFKDLTKNKPISILLSGGSTPIPFYNRLSKLEIEWNGISLLATDERIVSFKNKNSNTGMINKKLLSQIKSASLPLLIRDYPQNNKDINIKLEKLAIKLNNDYPPKVAFLGIGSDGHTAGLFNSFDSNLINNQFTITKRNNEKFKRVSISMESLLAIPNLIFFITGKNKHSILKEVFSGKDLEKKYPFFLLLKKHKGTKMIICDRAAAPDFIPKGKTSFSL